MASLGRGTLLIPTGVTIDLVSLLKIFANLDKLPSFRHKQLSVSGREQAILAHTGVYIRHEQGAAPPLAG
jgi:hypothetical protein